MPPIIKPIGAALVSALLLSPVAQAVPTFYSLEIIPSSQDAVAVNDSGVVIGRSSSGGYRWDAVNGTMLLPGRAGAVNNSGMVAGGQANGTIYTQTGSAAPVNLSLGGAASNANARGLNDVGVIAFDRVVGNSQVSSRYDTTTSTQQDLERIGGGTGSTRVNAINNAGLATGGDEAVNLAVYWAPGSTTAVSLGTLLNGNSEALGLNNSGQIVGYSESGPNGSGAYDAFIWANGVMTGLGSGTHRAWDISDTGLIVGDLDNFTGFVMDANDPTMTAYSLTSLLLPGQSYSNLTIGRVRSINENGQIAGQACGVGGENCFGVLLTPVAPGGGGGGGQGQVPLPGSLALLGLGAMAMLRRRPGQGV